MKALLTFFCLLVALHVLETRHSEAHKKPMDDGILKDIASIESQLPIKPIVPVPPFDMGDVEFYLYTRASPVKPIKLVDNNWYYLDTSKHTKFIIHGWTETYQEPYYINMKHDYLNNSDINVVLVNWAKPAYQRYAMSAVHTLQVADIIATRILRASQKDLDNVHLIGFCMGAHIAGFIGKTVTVKTVGKVLPRITGLDPSGPLFNVAPTLRLSSTDAHMVDVIHTDGGFFGFAAPMGTIDFYPNGGVRLQRGCLTKEPDDKIDCNHSRSYKFFLESINTKDFIATKCLNWATYAAGQCDSGERVPYGEQVFKDMKGNFFFTTNCLKPFAMAGSRNTDPC